MVSLTVKSFFTTPLIVKALMFMKWNWHFGFNHQNVEMTTGPTAISLLHS